LEVELNMATSFIGQQGDFSYAIKIDGVDPHFLSQPFGRQEESWVAIRTFRVSAKKYYVNAKGKSTIAAVKRWVKEEKPSQFFAKWRSDSSNWKDDSVEVYYFPSESIVRANPIRTRRVPSRSQWTESAPVMVTVLHADNTTDYMTGPFQNIPQAIGYARKHAPPGEHKFVVYVRGRKVRAQDVNNVDLNQNPISSTQIGLIATVLVGAAATVYLINNA
jgi:hypothetical protein